MSTPFGKVVQGEVVRAGYRYRIYLPGFGRTWQREAAAGGGVGVCVGPDEAEVLWCCYAWPTAYDESGRWAFFINQKGDALACRNELMRYSGTVAPGPTAACEPSGEVLDMATSAAYNRTGVDGQRWVLLN